MKIRMLVEMSGSRNGRPWPRRGEVTEDIPSAEAAHLCASGIAEHLTQETSQVGPAAAATPPPAQTAAAAEPDGPAAPTAPKRRGGRTKLPRDADGNVVPYKGTE